MKECTELRSHSSLGRLFEACFTLMNKQEVVIEMYAGTHVGLCVKYPLFLSDFKKSGMCKILLVKLPNSKFHEDPFSSSHVVTYIWMTQRSYQLHICNFLFWMHKENLHVRRAQLTWWLRRTHCMKRWNTILRIQKLKFHES